MKSFNHYFSRIKDVYLELPNFSFYHSPSGRFSDNPNLVGRQYIRRKLYGIFTNSETKSGTYIITGFRGMGKTSLVNQVINELQPRSGYFKVIFSIIITWLIFHFLLLSIEVNEFYKVILCIILLSINILRYSYNKLDIWPLNVVHQEINNLTKDTDKVEKEILTVEEKEVIKERKKFYPSNKIFNHILLFFIPDHRFKQKSFIDMIFHTFSYGALIELSWIILLQLILFFVNRKEPSYEVYLPINLYQIVIIAIVIMAFRIVSRHLLSVRSVGFLNLKKHRDSVYGGIKYYKQLLNHSQRVFIRLSFAQDSIESKDILKSLVNRMFKEYERYNPFNRVAAKVLIYLTILILSKGFYSHFIDKQIANPIKQDSALVYLFPSQYQNDSTKTILTEETIFQFKGLSAYEVFRDSLILNEFGGFVKNTKDFFITIDYSFTYAYQAILGFFFISPNSWISNLFVPHYPDLFYFIFLSMVLLTAKAVKRRGRFLGLVSNHYVVKLLKELNEKCLAAIDLNTSTSMGVNASHQGVRGSISSTRGKNTKYPIAGAREIENELIHIFDELDRIPRIFAPPQFTIIFDELDKIEPSELMNKLNGNGDKSESESVESHKTRRRRELVAGIMASMKVFFTTAKAKFIFIAGREIYDASLADSSDRESYLGSIFHDIIYVGSLYKDPFNDHHNRTNKPIDITYLTEKYVCQLLLPEDSDHKRNLQGYSNYIDEHLQNDLVSVNKINSPIAKIYTKEIIKQQKNKIISLLSKFIHYLAYRSKGSPMNLAKLLEDFVEEFTLRNDKVFFDENKLIIGRESSSYYLTFDYQAQYRLSFVGGIFRPYLMDTGLFMKYYSDKILVSTSYLIDHIYKFHEFGFSWRNLELLPEIIDINRAPLLRRHIEKIISFLTDSNLKKIDNGLINFKFHRKMIEEIKYLSRRSDTESAIFNFTLDESIVVKRHFEDRLKKLSEQYADFKGNIQFVNSIAFLESILGDLHFFDKEYDEAVIQYTDAMQTLRSSESNDWGLHQIFLFTKTMMRNALVFEKMNTYEPAFTKYSELVEIIRGMGKKLQRQSERDVALRNEDMINHQFDLNRYESMEVKWEDGEVSRKYQRITRSLSEEEQLEKDNQSDTFRYIHFAKSMFENLSLMTLPILSKLVVIEKIGKQGITLKDSLRADKDFHTIYNYLKKDEKYLFKVEYHLQKGDILFYKNGILFKDYYGHDIDAKNLLIDYGYPHGAGIHRDYNGPLSALKEYLTSAALFVRKVNNQFIIGPYSIFVDLNDESLDNEYEGQVHNSVKEVGKYERFNERLQNIFRNGNIRALEEDIAISVIEFLKFNEVSKLNITYREWNIAGKLFSALGDCLMILCPNPSLNNLKKTGLNKLFDLTKDTSDSKRLIKNANRLELALIYFLISSRCYEMGNEIRNHAFQKKKVLYTLKVFAKYFDPEYTKDINDYVLNKLMPALIGTYNLNRDLIIFPEISRKSFIENEFKLDELYKLEKLRKYYQFSYNTEIKISILHTYDLILSNSANNKIFKIKNLKSFEVFVKSVLDVFPINAYNTISNQTVRIFELRFKSRLNMVCLVQSFKQLFYQKHNKRYSSLIKKLMGNSTSWIKTNSFFKTLYEDQFPSSVISNIVSQPFDLQLFRFRILNELTDEIQSTLSLSTDPEREALEFLFIDSVFCELKIIDSILINDVTYVRGYFYLASAYLSLGIWLKNALQIFSNKLKTWKRSLVDHIGKHEAHYIDDPEYALRKSMSYYYKCINMHSEGENYKEILSNMYFSEGDFSDDNQHFCAAVDRLYINNGVVRKRIIFIKSLLKEKSIFQGR